MDRSGLQFATILLWRDALHLVEHTDEVVLVVEAQGVGQVADGSLQLGIALKSYQSNDCKFDHFTLEYLGGNSSAITNNYTEKKSVNTIRDLLGRRLTQMQKGFNLLNNKPIFVK